MLPVINLTLVAALCSLTVAQAEPTPSDLSWIEGITNQMEKLSKHHESEAKSIFEKVTKTAEHPQNCAIAERFATQAREIGRKSLESKDSQNSQDIRYPKLLVFVSFSMQMDTLKTLAQDVNRVGGKLVLRGLVKGSFPETLKKLQELKQELLIDPTLFESYQIQQVPTFILREQSTEGADEKVTYDMLKGNVSLGYALEQFSLNGDVKEHAKHLLHNLREKP
jgi:type-F conjugative transfer system pilin assembly protein TrbC